MKKQHDLFRLIKTLSGPEKRYFKLYASKHVEARRNNSVKLFAAIDEQESYNEQAIKERFAGERFVRQLAVQKNYLYDLVLRSLRSYHTGTSAGVRIAELIHNVEILLRQGLPDQCGTLLARAKELAYRHDDSTMALRVLKLAWRVAYDTNDRMAMKQLAEEQRELLAMLMNESLYTGMLFELNHALQYYGYSNHPASVSLAQHILAEEALRDESCALTVRTRIMFHSLRSACLEIVGEIEACHAAAQRCLELVEAHPDKSTDMQWRRLFCLTELIKASLRMDRLEEMRGYILRLETFGRTSGDLRTHVERVTHQFTLSGNLRSGDLRAALRSAPRVESILQCRTNAIGPAMRMLIRYELAHLYFATENHRTALGHLNSIADAAEDDVRPDFQAAARVLMVLAHHMLGHADAVEYMTISARRFLNRLAGRFSMDSIAPNLLPAIAELFILIKHLANAPSHRMVADEIQRFRARLECRGISLSSLTALLHVDMEAWITSIHDRTTYETALGARRG
ncbi:MAG: hypothetical protein JST22_13380 [Bacteroidetes bacterium]|nr:hypothetical protein [Bacteroidota bacterium]